MATNNKDIIWFDIIFGSAFGIMFCVAMTGVALGHLHHLLTAFCSAVVSIACYIEYKKLTVKNKRKYV